MNKLFYLVKISLLSTIDSMGSATVAKNKKSNKKFAAFGIMAFIFGLVVFYSFMINSQFAAVLAPAGLMHVQMGLMMAVTSVMTLFFSVGMVQNTMFEFKDFDMLMSLPVSTKTIIASRFIVIYLSNFMFTAVIMLPAFVVYIINVTISSTFVLGFLLTLFFIPFIPIIIATMIGTFVAFCSSRFKATKHISTIFLFLIFIGIMFLSYSYSYSLNNFEEIGVMLLDSINQIYPLTSLYVEGVCNENVLSLLGFIGIGAVLFALYVFIVSGNFIPLYESVNKKPANTKYKMSAQQSKSPITSLIKKELTIYFSSQPYVFNTLFGMVILVIALGAIVIYKDMALEMVGEMGIPLDIVFQLLPVYMGFLVSLSCTTPYAISFEGKSLWVIKSCPVGIKTVFLSKLAVTWIITVPVILLTAIVTWITFDYGFVTFLLFLITPTIITLFSSLFGMVINLNYPNLDWTNEAVIVKNSSATMFYIFIQMGISMGAIILSVIVATSQFLPATLITTAITVFYTAGAVVCYRIMMTQGIKQFADM